MSNIVYIVLSVILIVIIVILFMFNKLVRLYNKVKKSKSNIEVYLNIRFDLIPNLVETVKAYSKHEDKTLENITALRSDYNNMKSLKLEDVSKLDNQLNKYIAIIESYPELKANEEFLNLQKELRETEDQLAFARRVYNDEATNYNIATEVVPSNIVALIFAFKKVDLFELEDSKKENIKVDL